MKRFLSGFIVLFLFWAAFAGSFSIAEVFVGAAAAAVISLLTVRIFDFNILTPDLPVRLIRFVFVYLPRLVWEMTKANITMAKIVLDPSLPIDPGIVVKKKYEVVNLRAIARGKESRLPGETIGKYLVI